MRSRRSVRMAMLGVVLPGCLMLVMAGCDVGSPPSGSGAIVTADYLEKQRVKVEQYRASLKARPSAKAVVRR